MTNGCDLIKFKYLASLIDLKLDLSAVTLYYVSKVTPQFPDTSVKEGTLMTLVFP